MSRPMRRADRQMDLPWTQALLARAEYGLLATADPAGQPYAVPISYAYDGDESIYIHCAPEGHKLDNLRANPLACFTVIGRTQVLPAQFSTVYESAIAFGTVSELEGAEKRTALRLIAAKYNPGQDAANDAYIAANFARVAVLHFHITHLTGKQRP